MTLTNFILAVVAPAIFFVIFAAIIYFKMGPEPKKSDKKSS